MPHFSLDLRAARQQAQPQLERQVIVVLGARLQADRMDRDSLDDLSPQPGESLDEAEDELGIGKWIDPDTGAPAEGASPPHLDDDWT